MRIRAALSGVPGARKMNDQSRRSARDSKSRWSDSVLVLVTSHVERGLSGEALSDDPSESAEAAALTFCGGH